MKNATRLHKREIVEFLTERGCSSIHFENGSIVALRTGRDGRLYPVSVDLYEEDPHGADPALRFRTRAARRFGLPVTYNHGDTVLSALAGIHWPTLDRPLTRPAGPTLSEVP
jgi:hypothetical protein